MYETFKEDIEDACREHGNKKKRWTKEKRQDLVWCWTATCPATALEAMCFHLDRRGTPDSLAFVQFPQMFHNLSRNDIYTNDLRSLSLPYDSWPIPWPGSEPRRQPLSAVRSSARTVWILRFPVILHKSPRTSSKYNPPSTSLSQICFQISP